jgi:hypothetical protein
MTLNEDGTAVGEPRRYCDLSKTACIKLNLTRLRGPRTVQEDLEEEEEESEEEEDSEEDSEDDSEEEKEKEELTRAQKRELKQKQASASKKPVAKKDEEDEEDEDLINPNHVTKKMNISDLSAPRQLSRRERSAIPDVVIVN